MFKINIKDTRTTSGTLELRLLEYLWKSQLIEILIVDFLWYHPDKLVWMWNTYDLVDCSFCFYSYIHFDLLTHFEPVFPFYTLWGGTLAKNKLFVLIFA